MTPHHIQSITRLAAILTILATTTSISAEDLELNARSQKLNDNGTSYNETNETLSWDPKETAIVVCDMWNEHWCDGASRRVAEMAPRMNQVLHAARDRGVLIIHCPSSCLDFYKDTPMRQRAQNAPVSEPVRELQGWCHIDPEKEPALPIDDSDGGCDCDPQCEQGSPWFRQIETLDIEPQDAITDSAEAYYLMRQRGIKNVIVMGVHTNMCVLGRPFSIRQMVYQNQDVVLMRDMTDCMYNSRMSPYVSHFDGLRLVVQHIERHWAPSITSADFLGGNSFIFREDQ